MFLALTTPLVQEPMVAYVGSQQRSKRQGMTSQYWIGLELRYTHTYTYTQPGRTGHMKHVTVSKSIHIENAY